MKKQIIKREKGLYIYIYILIERAAKNAGDYQRKARWIGKQETRKRQKGEEEGERTKVEIKIEKIKGYKEC